MGMAGLFPQRVQYPTGSLQQGVYYPNQGVQTLSGPPQGVQLVPGPSQPPVQFTTGVQQQQGGSFPGSVHLGDTGDFYPVTKPSTIPHAFLSSQYTWHQRLGHPGSEALRRLVSSESISCNKDKLPVLCHACQLSKHMKLPFVSSSSSVTLCFDIVYLDLWTSLIPSLSGF
nr:ribonuclease H-like domain-containing protein [Tanacetum cinerariifolium]